MTRPTKAYSKNTRTALTCAGVVAGMVGLSFASVPLYELFCQVTGFGGTTQRADVEDLPAEVSNQTITISFDANVAKELGWSFKPEANKIVVRVGEQSLAAYEAKNRGSVPTTGTAAFNVTPHKVGPYFSKIHCFCFDEQRLVPGQEVTMPVQFYIDPEILTDPNTREVKNIALSYTFFKTDDAEEPAEQLSSNVSSDKTVTPQG